MSEFKRSLMDRVQRSLVNNTKDHVVQQLHGDDDTVKLWRCGKPQSSTYMFYVCSAPNCLMVYGDMGECMWQRHYDMIPFVRGSVHSLDYFSEKVPADLRDGIMTDHKELIDEWLAGVKEEQIELGYEWTKEQDRALEEIRGSYSHYESPDDFRRAVYESDLYRDCDSMPAVSWYTYHYLWKIEALKWFIQKLDAGEVVK